MNGEEERDEITGLVKTLTSKMKPSNSFSDSLPLLKNTSPSKSAYNHTSCGGGVGSVKKREQGPVSYGSRYVHVLLDICLVPTVLRMLSYIHFLNPLTRVHFYTHTSTKLAFPSFGVLFNFKIQCIAGGGRQGWACEEKECSTTTT